jgi:Ca-activated chloride channel family protein
MDEKNARRRTRMIVIAIIVLLIILLLLLLTRCLPEKPSTPEATITVSRPVPDGSAASSAPATTEPDEILTPATIVAPAQVTAGAAFSVRWTGPDNRGDFLTIVRPDAPAESFASYLKTNHGASLELTAPIEHGAHEVRYVTGRSHTILGRAPIEVVPAGVTLDAPAEVVLGAEFSVAWVGPNNTGDYVTIVAKDAPDEHYGNYKDAEQGSPQTLTAPAVAGDAELRYVSGQGRKVLARRTIRIVMAEVTLSAPTEAVAGTTVQVAWTGPNNAGDYITVVPSETPDGQYGNYTNTSSGSPLNLLLPIMSGAAELRYMTGQRRQVLSRRPITIVPAEVTLSAPAVGSVGAEVSVTWTGPDNPGDYITVVAKETPDGQYAAYTMTTEGSPLNVALPKEIGDAEIRYMTGQGNKVLARIPIKVVDGP